MAKYTYHPVCAMPGKGPGVIMEGLSKACFDEIRAFVMNNWSDSEEYKMKRGVDPFLQGQDERIGWLFIEFWGANKEAKNLYAEEIHKIFEFHERRSKYPIESRSSILHMDPDAEPLTYRQYMLRKQSIETMRQLDDLGGQPTPKESRKAFEKSSEMMHCLCASINSDKHIAQRPQRIKWLRGKYVHRHKGKDLRRGISGHWSNQAKQHFPRVSVGLDVAHLAAFWAQSWTLGDQIPASNFPSRDCGMTPTRMQLMGGHAVQVPIERNQPSTDNEA